MRSTVDRLTNALVCSHAWRAQEREYLNVRQTGLKQTQPERRAESKPVILYVEDDEDNWDVASLRLGNHYELLRASSAEEACTVLREHGHRLSLVMMDIELRGSDFSGTELTDLWRGQRASDEALPAYARNLPKLTKPILFVTAHSAQHELVKVMLAGGEQVISKPVNFADLLAALERLT
jgi:CheY-like chemotaxis protein